MRQLNVIFLDLCARLIGRPGQALPSLHWGFWPTNAPGTSTGADDYDPFEGFSENLLAYIPLDTTRILDVGCGLGANARILASRGRLVTAVSPIAHHCAEIEKANLPGVEVKCARFEELPADAKYDLLLFSESVNHFALGPEFFEYCKRFLRDSGFILLADDLTEDRARLIETQRALRIVQSVDITKNVAPTTRWWTQQLRTCGAYRTALIDILETVDPPVASRVREILDELESDDLKSLLSGLQDPAVSKGRYMIYLLQLV